MFDEFGNLITTPMNTGFSMPSYRGWSAPGIDVNGANGVSTAALSAPMGNLSQQAMASGIASPTAIGAAPASGSIWDSFLGSPGQQGWGGLALGAASGLLNGYLGFQQLGVAKKSLAQGQKQFDLNFGAQQKMTNSRLADRQATRIASGLNVAPVADYMKRYGI